MEYKDNEMYLRGRDYPILKGGNGIKMHKAMTGKEVKQWFTKEELKGYPHPNGYTGSLPF